MVPVQRLLRNCFAALEHILERTRLDFPEIRIFAEFDSIHVAVACYTKGARSTDIHVKAVGERDSAWNHCYILLELSREPLIF